MLRLVGYRVPREWAALGKGLRGRASLGGFKRESRAGFLGGKRRLGVWARGAICAPRGLGGRDLGHTVGGCAAWSGASVCGIGSVFCSVFRHIWYANWSIVGIYVLHLCGRASNCFSSSLTLKRFRIFFSRMLTQYPYDVLSQIQKRCQFFYVYDMYSCCCCFLMKDKIDFHCTWRLRGTPSEPAAVYF